MTGDVSGSLFNLAFACFGMQALFAWLLRRRVEDDEPLLRVLFASPATQGQREPGRLLRVKFFWPLTQVPSELAECVPMTVALFWAARLAGFGFILSIAAFFVTPFVQASA